MVKYQISMSQIVAEQMSSQNILRHNTHTSVQLSSGVRQLQHAVGELLGVELGVALGVALGELVSSTH